MIRLPNSLQFRLMGAMIVLMAALALLLVGGVQLLGWTAERELKEGLLEAQARSLAQRIDSRPGLEKPGTNYLRSLPSIDRKGRTAFAVHDGEGRLLVAEPDWFRRYLSQEKAQWKLGEDPRRFIAPNGKETAFHGLQRAYETGAGTLHITVARSGLGKGIPHRILEDLVHDLLWWIPPLMGAVLGVGIVALRRGLRPVRTAAEAAAAIGPDSDFERLPEKELPAEIRPLVKAVNQAFERLTEAMERQREFTADAAHQLRTPLAVLSAAIEELPEQNRGGLKRDVERMQRLVTQLLNVARLDRSLVDTDDWLDLVQVTREVVAELAPLALDRGREIRLESGPGRLWIQGNPEAIFQAITNLIENALAYTPTGTPVEVTVHPDGRLTVADQGPGLPSQGIDRLFQRFRQGPGPEPRTTETGAGIGLAIVAKTMDLHGGTVHAENRPEGGAVFTLAFPQAYFEDDSPVPSA